MRLTTMNLKKAMLVLVLGVFFWSCTKGSDDTGNYTNISSIFLRELKFGNGNKRLGFMRGGGGRLSYYSQGGLYEGPQNDNYRFYYKYDDNKKLIEVEYKPNLLIGTTKTVKVVYNSENVVEKLITTHIPTNTTKTYLIKSEGGQFVEMREATGGITYLFTYDAKGRLTTKTVKGIGSGEFVHNYTWDDNNGPLRNYVQRKLLFCTSELILDDQKAYLNVFMSDYNLTAWSRLNTENGKKDIVNITDYEYSQEKFPLKAKRTIGLVGTPIAVEPMSFLY